MKSHILPTSSVWLACFAACFTGCNPPTETIPTLKPRMSPPTRNWGTPYNSGMTGSGMTSSGMTWSSGMTSSGLTSSGITYSNSGMMRSGSGITRSSSGITIPRQGIKIPKKITIPGPNYRYQGNREAATTEESTPEPNPTTDDSAQKNTNAVELRMVGFEDLKKEVAKHAGKVVVLDVWSTSCIPCMREYPNLVALAEKHADSVACISLNVDYIGLPKKPVEDYIPGVQKFLEKQNSKLTNLISSDVDEDMRDDLEVTSIPAILIYNKDGELFKRLGDDNSGNDGLTYEGDVIPVVQSLLN